MTRKEFFKRLFTGAIALPSILKAQAKQEPPKPVSKLVERRLKEFRAMFKEGEIEDRIELPEGWSWVEFPSDKK